MKLWIDDLRAPPDDSWTWAKDSVQARNRVTQAIIGLFALQEVSFDHDLGGNDNGVIVADLIEDAAFVGKLPRIKWFVHSANPPGRDRIRAAMESADRYWDAQEVASDS